VTTGSHELRHLTSKVSSEPQHATGRIQCANLQHCQRRIASSASFDCDLQAEGHTSAHAFVILSAQNVSANNIFNCIKHLPPFTQHFAHVFSHCPYQLEDDDGKHSLCLFFHGIATTELQ